MAGRRVAVALGSGGARGYAHIGALEVLAERGHEVVAIAGTSMGALVGAFAASDRMPSLTDWVLGLSQREVLRLMDPSLRGPGVLRAHRLIERVSDLLADSAIEDFAIPFTAVATDLDARREVWFQRGPADVAIRASIAIPWVIRPILVDGRLLVDGGLMNPVPIEPTRAVPSDVTVAVSLNGVRHGREVAEPEPKSPLRTFLDNSEHLQRLSARLAASLARDEVDGPDPLEDDDLPKDLTTADIVSRSFDTMSALVARYRMASNPPDVLVSVPSDACRTLDFHRAAEMIDLGRELTARALDERGL